MELRGTWYVVPTPFRGDGGLDAESQSALVDAAISWGVDGLTVMGVMSEVTHLTPEERAIALRVIFSVAAGRVPVAVGCSAPSPVAVSANISAAADLGAAAAMVSAPALLKNVDVLPAFFEEVGRASPVPLVVQDEPAATGTIVPVSVLLRCLEAAGATRVKLEDPPTPPKLSRLLALRRDLNVFGGLGGVSALAELERGGCGTMTGFSYPEILAAVRIAVENGERDRAAELFDRYLPLIAFEGQVGVGLAIRKEILVRRGAIATNTVRAPARMDDATMHEIDHLLDRLGIEPGIKPFEIPPFETS